MMNIPGYVPRAELDAETHARVRAEERAGSWRELCERLALERDRLLEQLKELSLSHERQVQTLLQHVVPIAPIGAVPDATLRRLPTAEEIMAMPAATKRDMHLRAMRAAAARRREDEEQAQREHHQRQESLTPEEQREMTRDVYFDQTLGLIVDQESAEETNELSQ